MMSNHGVLLPNSRPHAPFTRESLDEEHWWEILGTLPVFSIKLGSAPI
jgi:hypothetical protein